jgi:hypothetical protein
MHFAVGTLTSDRLKGLITTGGQTEAVRPGFGSASRSDVVLMHIAGDALTSDRLTQLKPVNRYRKIKNYSVYEDHIVVII